MIAPGKYWLVASSEPGGGEDRGIKIKNYCKLVVDKSQPEAGESFLQTL